MMETDGTTGLVLDSASLCSRWGFNDGDMPDFVLDALEESGQSYGSVDWHQVLATLVEDHLLPELREHHAVETYRVSTTHNPIRASSIDGVAVDAAGDYDERLTPEWVEVPLAEVLAACCRSGG